MLPIGILALQGGYKAHQRMVEGLSAHSKLITKAKQLDNISGLIIPGGESSTMLKLLTDEFKEKILELNQRQLPIFGTCAGCILMAKVVRPTQYSLGILDITVQRNYYGRQLESFSTTLETNTKHKKINAVFIRAPGIIAANDNVRKLAIYEGKPVLVQQGNVLAATFHPELTNDFSIHELFLEQIRS